MKYAYYPGCSLHGTSKEYNDATLAVCEKLGIELHEIPDWNCCGASSAHSVSHLLGLALPGDTLCQAEDMGMDVVAPCAACYQRLKFAEVEMLTNPELKAKVEEVMDRKYQGKSRTLSILEVVAAIGYDELAKKVTKPLNGLKVACYYGCFYVKPPQICNVDDPENPQIMDNVVKALGGEPLDWPFKTECCGNSQIFQDKNAVFKLSNDILNAAEKAGADAILAACPLCHMNLDQRQGQINRKLKVKHNIPIVYITELMGIALGLEPSAWLKKHIVSTNSMMQKIG